jgi:formylglycine-generating enzyme required for sulfatase activity
MLPARITTTALLFLAAGSAQPINLTQAQALAEASTLQITADVISCVSGTADRRAGSGFVVSDNGYVITAAHLFRSGTCDDNVQEIVGIFNKETAPTTDESQRTVTLQKLRIESDSDVAILRIMGNDGPIPQALTMCRTLAPDPGTEFFAFGYPFGTTLTALPVHFNRVDVTTKRWLVTGLTIDGMSGGPVLDRAGNVVAMVQGGEAVVTKLPGSTGATVREQVYAVRHLVPATSIPVDRMFSRNCGFHPVRIPAKPVDSVSTTCALGESAEWTTSFSPDRTFAVLQPSGAPTADGGVKASFNAQVARLVLEQYGLDHPSYEREWDLLACRAASLNRVDVLREPQDADAAQRQKRVLSAVQTTQDASFPLSYDDCYRRSGWPRRFLGGAAADATINASVQHFRVLTNEHGMEGRNDFPIHFARVGGGYIGAFAIFGVVRTLDRDRPLLPDGRRLGYAEQFDSSFAFSVPGVKVECDSTDAISFTDFQRLCKRAVELAVGEHGVESGTCLKAVNAFAEQVSPFSDVLDGSALAPKLVELAGGEFEMGAPKSDFPSGRYSEEWPQHPVQVGPFALGQTEVTVAEFRRFVAATGYVTDAEKPAGEDKVDCWHPAAVGAHTRPEYNWRNPGFKQADSHPVVCVTKGDARAYVRWLSDQTGETYRLPSEAEQEYALRAGSISRHPWGETVAGACQYANIFDLATSETHGVAVSCSDGFRYTAPVGSLRANAFGLYDTVGNVWEWSADDWFEDYEGAPADGSPRSGSGGNGVIRGSGFGSNEEGIRAAFRLREPINNATVDLGFRVARDL